MYGAYDTDKDFFTQFVQNSEKLTEMLTEAKIYADGDGNVTGALETLDNICTAISNGAGYNPNLSSLSEKLMDIYYNLQDCVSEINDNLENIDSDTYRLNDIEERLDLIHKLKRKYGNTIEEILNYQIEIEKKINLIKLIVYTIVILK